MQFKAEVTERDARRIVRLSGRLNSEQSPEVARLCGQDHTVVRLDLTDLVSTDDTGLATLGLLQSQGIELVGASPYLALQLESWRTRRGPSASGSVVGTGDTGTDRTGHTRNMEDR